MEAVELILHELRPKWKNKIAEVTWGLRRLHVNFEKAVSGSDPLQGSDNEITKFGTTSSAQMKMTSLSLVVDAVSRCEKRQRADKGGSAQKINLKIIMIT